MIKTADYQLDNISNWEDEIFKYFTRKYPFIAKGLTKIEFTKKDRRNNDGIGKAVYRDKVIIPLIVNDGVLYEPNVALYKGESIPVDEGYFEKVVNLDLTGNKVSHRYLINGDIMREYGLYDISHSGIRKLSNEKYKALNRLYDSLSDITQSQIDSFEYIRDPGIRMVKKAEDRTIPYHYHVWMVKESNDVFPIVEKKFMNEKEVKIIEKKASSPNNGQSPPKDKYNKLKDLNDSNLWRISSLRGYPGIKGIGVKSPLTFTNDDVRGDLIIFIDKEDYDDYNIWKNLMTRINKNIYKSDVAPSDELFYWAMIDKTKDADVRAIKIDEDGINSIHPYGVSAISETIGNGDILAFQLKNKLSIPYQVMKSIITKIDDNDYLIVQFRSLLNNKIFNAIFGFMGLEKPILISAKKAMSLGFDIPGSGYYPTYALPEIKIIKIANKRNLIDTKKLEKGEKLIAIIKSAGYDYTIELQHGEKKKQYKSLDKNAALLLMNYVTGMNNKSITQYVPNKIYKSANVVKGRENSEFNKFGELIKIADLINRVSEYLEKDADVKNLAKLMIGLDLFDENPISNLAKLKLDIEKLIKAIGNLILQNRTRREIVKPNILNDAFIKLTNLWNSL